MQLKPAACAPLTKRAPVAGEDMGRCCLLRHLEVRPPLNFAARTKFDHRKKALRLAIQYVVVLASTHAIGLLDAAAILLPLRGNASGIALAYFTCSNKKTLFMLLLLGTALTTIGGVILLTPTLRWFVTAQVPTAKQRRSAMQLTGRQSAVLGAVWGICGAILVLTNIDDAARLDTGASKVEFLGSIVLFATLGGSASVTTGLLLVHRFVRPILIAATPDSEVRSVSPGVFGRLIIVWFLCSVLPIGVIAALVVMYSEDWIISKTGSLIVPVSTMAIGAVVLGLPTMMLTARTISDPVSEVVDAMTEVEYGRIGSGVAIYERAQLGRLQRGFNRMVAGLVERDLLTDLFGRHVGRHVARYAIDNGISLSGDVVEVAVLFIDLVDSTRLAASLPPQDFAQVLNSFFRIVVDAVDKHHGLINKFAGDAALAIFGAPLQTTEPASAALATARVLRSQLRRLPTVDFGIGVSAGPAFAGNIGAENRYEYTVIGDAVNEAARLADLAKTSQRRTYCSSAALDRADADERSRWTEQYSTVLRGRKEPTHISSPKDLTT
ncbi:adenylate/guanylate cyclase domain-containing protein [Mycobacterium simiae]|nr:adenylate/guanylate cyclase domain-containing protein [Mycobacterium simiae]